MNSDLIDLSTVSGKWNDGECSNILFDNKNVRLEHVFMPSKSSLPGFWYDVSEDEWGLVIFGSISFQYYEFGIAEITYHKGQHFFIPRHQKHRIKITSPDCIVLCVFIK